MTVPILGQQPNGVCVVCKGALTPDHEHVYVDTKQIAYYNYLDNALINLIDMGCVIPTDAGLYPAHPQLASNYMWYPVKITHPEQHEGCKITFPHHHCDPEGVDNPAEPTSDVPRTTSG